jgi:hypothetical protein
MLHPYALARAYSLAFMLFALGCGRKDAPPTDDTGGGAATTAAVSVEDIKVGRAIGADKRLTTETDEFRPSDTIFAVVETRGSGPNTSLQARWTYEDGQVVDESTRNIAASVEDATEFHISKPSGSGWPKGKYKVEILLNGAPAGSEDFEVK